MRQQKKRKKARDNDYFENLGNLYFGSFIAGLVIFAIYVIIYVIYKWLT